MLEEKKFENEENIRTFQSLLKKGICPLSALSIAESFPNPTLGVEKVRGNVSVNFIDFTNPWMTKESKSNVVNIATFEEYTGIFGISLERRWSFQSQKTNKINMDEITKRLCASIVVVLKADQDDSLTVLCSLAASELKSSSRKDLVVGTKVSNDLNAESSITEIKTSHVFPLKEWLAILVPEPLIELASSIFKGKIKIISVPIKKTKLNKLPEILAYLHLETLGGPVEVYAPQYDTALNNFIEKEKLKKFLLHAVRLNTTYDFNYWYIDDLKKNHGLITRLHGKIVQQNSSGSGWVKFHKSVATTTQRERLNEIYPLTVAKEISEANQFNQQSYEELLRVKQSQTTNEKRQIYGKLSAEKIEILKNQGAQVLSVHGYWILAFPKSLTPKVEEIISKNPEQIKLEQLKKLEEERSARILQAAICSALSTTTLFKIVKKQEQIKTLQNEITELRQSL